MSIGATINALLHRNMNRSLQHVGDVWATATLAEASELPIGRLVTDVHFEVTGPHSGKLIIGVKGKWVITGSRPHIIEPRVARALHFKMNGHEVFAMRVHHPGTRPNDFPGRAWNSASMQMARYRFGANLLTRE